MSYPYGRAILITGASSGIGLAAARLFAQSGYHVFAASRRCEEGTQGNITSIRMDIRDEASVLRARDMIAARGGVGIVLNCAGISLAGAAEDTPEADLRAQFETNYFGTLRVNRVFLPMLRARGGGLVLVVGSVAGQIPLPYHCHYSGTKFALDAYTQALRMEAGPFGVRASLIQPGGTRTGLTGARQFAPPAGSPYTKACAAAEASLAREEQTGAPAEQPARVALRLAQQKNPPVRATVGAGYKFLVASRRAMPDRLLEFMLQRKYR